MGSVGHVAYMNGKQDEQKTLGRYYGRRRRAYNACVAQVEEMIDNGEYDRARFDELLETRLQYSESYTTVHGLVMTDEEFSSEDEMLTYMFDSDEAVEKWEYAKAARVKLTPEQAEREGVALDEDGYAWVICAILAC